MGEQRYKATCVSDWVWYLCIKFKWNLHWNYHVMVWTRVDGPQQKGLREVSEYPLAYWSCSYEKQLRDRPLQNRSKILVWSIFSDILTSCCYDEQLWARPQQNRSKKVVQVHWGKPELCLRETTGWWTQQKGLRVVSEYPLAYWWAVLMRKNWVIDLSRTGLRKLSEYIEAYLNCSYEEQLSDWPKA